MDPVAKLLLTLIPSYQHPFLKFQAWAKHIIENSVQI